MTKADFVRVVANKVSIPKSTVLDILTAMSETVIETVASGESVKITELGSFGLKLRPAHEGRNPQTGEAITVQAKKLPVFTPSPKFKAAVNG